jgi:transposase-like protein
LARKPYVYIWDDGVYFNIRSDDAKQCILVIIDVIEHGKKEFIAIEDGYRESEQSWSELLLRIKAQGLSQSPKLAVGDGSLGFWKAINKVFPKTKHQRCWVYKTVNVLNKLPKMVQPKVKQALHEIWMAPTRKDAYEAFEILHSQRIQRNIGEQWNVLRKTKWRCWLFMTFQQHIGNTYEPPTQLNQHLRLFVCGRKKQEDVLPGIRF